MKKKKKYSFHASWKIEDIFNELLLQDKISKIYLKYLW